MNTFIENGIYIAEFDAYELKTEKQFIDALWNAFNIPNEKKYNLNVLNDYMTDLFWIEPKSFKVIIKGYRHYIQKSYNLNFVIENLNYYKKYWNGKGYKFHIELD